MTPVTRESWVWIACGVLLFAPTALAAQRGVGRVRPPEAVTCPRNDLTLYAGRVVTFDRKKDSTSLTIATDWNTTERVEIRHPDTPDPDAWFLMKGKPFAKEHWDVIAPQGKLRDGVRANAWVCSDGRNPVIDWEQPGGGSGGVPYFP